MAGIDSGSTTTNVVVLDRAGNVAASAIVRTGPKASQGAEKAFAALGGFTPEDMAAIVATGYGRNNIPFATGQVTEITCHARGPTTSTRRPGPSWTSAARTARSSAWTRRAA